MVVWCKLYRSSIWKNIRFPAGLKHEDDYVNPQVVLAAHKIVGNEKCYYYYNKTNENSIMAGRNITRRYIYFLCGLQKIKAVEGRFPELYPYAVTKAFEQAFKAWNSNVYTHYLTNQQQQEIEDFIDKYSKDKNLLPFCLKVQLLAYYHCRFINKLKGFYYLIKYRDK